MIELSDEIKEHYFIRNNNWVCIKCNNAVRFGFLKHIGNCNGHPRRIQQKMEEEKLVEYFNVIDNKWFCLKCDQHINCKRLLHTKSCNGNGKESLRKNANPFNKICDMGCGNLALFGYKNGKVYCCHLGAKCPVKVKKDRKKKVGTNPFLGKKEPSRFLGKKSPFKGLTKENCEYLVRVGLGVKKAFLEKGDQRKKKHHTPETRQKMSDKIKDRYASGWETVCGRAKKYKHISPIAGEITVDGTWELAFAQICDKTNLNWIRNKQRFDYINPKGEISTYQPDFYVSDWNTFIEVKGYHTELDNLKWTQFNDDLFVVKKGHINIIKKWLADNCEISKDSLFELIKESTKDKNLMNFIQK